MAKRQISKGKCSFCGGVFGKNAIRKHLNSCEKRKLPPTKFFHLLVEGRYEPEYWLHLAAPVSATLENLDGFLREIWLECCGHLSAFTIGEERYVINPIEELEGKNMKVELEKALSPNLKFEHEYDYGSTTHLKLKVISEQGSGTRDTKIQLLARNEPPEIKCYSCGKIATCVCTQCIYDGKGWLCDECADKHNCQKIEFPEEMLLPIVNSPRVGVCGYTG